jgi:thiol-disulfide isomerase/thioredoxin
LSRKNRFNLLIIAIAFISVACNENEEKVKTVIPKKQNSVVIENLISNVILDTPDSNMTTKHIKSKISNKKLEAVATTFTFQNFKNQISKLHLKNDIYNFTNIEQPIVMVNLSSTWCPPCRGQVPHLSSLQKRFKDNLFILTALVHDDIKDSELKKLIVSEKAQFFVSINQVENEKFEKMIIKKLGITDKLKLPLMVLFSNGKYFTHYEGNMPEEMIESDIKLLLEKIKERKK